MLHALDCVLVAVRDLDAAAACYAALLGRAPAAERAGAPTASKADPSGLRRVRFELANTAVELVAPPANAAPSPETGATRAATPPPGGLAAAVRERLEREGEGPLGLVFATEDAKACAQQLQDAGIGVEKTDGSPPGLELVLSREASRGIPVFAVERRAGESAKRERAPATCGGASHRSGSDPGAPDACAADALASPARAHAVDHVVIQCADLDAAIALYRDALGLRLALDRTFDDRGLRILFFRVGGVTLEVVGPPSANSAPGSDAPPGADRAEGSAQSPGLDRLWGIAYRFTDVEAARTRLAAADFDVSPVRPGVKPGTRVCTVREPTHGVATLLIEPAPR